ncbi:OLC1v1026723C1 [Oldenlandia corymbosa var. corymbosa]|uniref:OLC1v1026723C1 n=1 Tax=Oldenlandia corymbosa var. corymbosa TaxID=529605 RepID=A0AAV1C9Y4_OLDCO|nr:OLC1v1026723C1 [Oldenlandia corymbosa var. corymbosa]
MVIEMLPGDLPFTIFLPSITAFERILGLHSNESLEGENGRDTYAVLTRVLGFSAVPRMIHSVDVPRDQEIDYDSLAGFTLYISRDDDGMLLVNRVRSEHVDLQGKNNLIVHIMDGVIMDADFEQSVLPDDDEDNVG